VSTQPVVHYQSAEQVSKIPACRNAVVVSEGESGEGRTLAVFFPDGMSYMDDIRYDSDPAEPAEGTWHFADWCPALGKDAPGRKAASEAGENARRESLRAEAARLGLVPSGVLSLDGIEARLNTIGQRIGSSVKDGEPGIIAQLARLEALQAVMARQVEEIHRTLGLERDEDDIPVGRLLTPEQQELLFRLIGRDPDMPGQMIIVGEQSTFEAAKAATSAAPAWIMSGVNGHAIAVIIPAADWHAPGTCCCSNCPWDNKHETR
jgi:hypothetical protein